MSNHNALLGIQARWFATPLGLWRRTRGWRKSLGLPVPTHAYSCTHLCTHLCAERMRWMSGPPTLSCVLITRPRPRNANTWQYTDIVSTLNIFHLSAGITFLSNVCLTSIRVRFCLAASQPSALLPFVAILTGHRFLHFPLLLILTHFHALTSHLYSPIDR